MNDNVNYGNTYVFMSMYIFLDCFDFTAIYVNWE